MKYAGPVSLSIVQDPSSGWWDAHIKVNGYESFNCVATFGHAWGLLRQAFDAADEASDETISGEIDREP